MLIIQVRDAVPLGSVVAPKEDWGGREGEVQGATNKTMWRIFSRYLVMWSLGRERNQGQRLTSSSALYTICMVDPYPRCFHCTTSVCLMIFLSPPLLKATLPVDRMDASREGRRQSSSPMLWVGRSLGVHLSLQLKAQVMLNFHGNTPPSRHSVNVV